MLRWVKEGNTEEYPLYDSIIQSSMTSKNTDDEISHYKVSSGREQLQSEKGQEEIL